jgi:hypothetical protein
MMNESPVISPKQGYRILWFVLGAILFGALMALRAELENIWARAFVAGLAGMVLVAAITKLRRKQ